jgi:AraC-like DNA-binding protein
MNQVKSQHSTLATFVLPIAQSLRMQGIDAMTVIEAVGIDPAVIVNSDRRVSPATMQALFARAVAETGDEAFGLQAAEQIQPQVLNGLGLAWLASDTLLDGLKRMVRFCQVMTTGVDMKLVQQGDLVKLIIGPKVQDEDFVFATRDFAMGLILRMCRLTLGEYFAPVLVEMERPQPQDPDRWEYMLSSRVKFSCSQACLTFSLADLTETLITGDPVLARVNDEQIQDYLDSFSEHTLTRDVIDQIVQKLPDGAPSQQQIAETLNVSNRTLQRRLKEEGTSFMDLLNDTRLQLARKYLGQRNRSVVETAYMLGFSEPSTFSRAFKRWTGVAPAEFREKTRED